MLSEFQILICANPRSWLKTTTDFLVEKNYVVDFAKTEDELNNFLIHRTIHLVIAELDFEIKDGITLTTDVRNMQLTGQPFIILFTDKYDDYIQITAFNAGADDFIVSPIKPILLEARIAALKNRLHKKNKNIIANNVITKFNVNRDEYLIILNNNKIVLPRKEFEMINLMFQNRHKVFTRQEFAVMIWNSAEVANSRTIDIHIRNIRRLLGNDIVNTTKGVGYSINESLL